MKLPFTVLLLILIGSISPVAWAFEFFPFGPILHSFPLTLEEGKRTEAVGPIYHQQVDATGETWAFSPLVSGRRSNTPDLTEIEFIYPILSYDRFGQEFRWQLLQVISWSGGGSSKGGEKKRLTIFPFYFQQRSKANPEDNYTAFLPFYGHLRNRLLRDEVKFILLPLYVQSRKRDVVTDNYVYPIFHLRKGTGLKGWQVWPLVGREFKERTVATNSWNESVESPGHKKLFVLWPFFFKNRIGIGSTNEGTQNVLIPFYSVQRSPLRDSTSYGIPLGFTHTVDREKQYEEWDAPWPFIVFARGEGKTANRIWPLFSKAKTPTLQSDFYLWPIYKFNRVTAEPLDRRRTRILLFLYSDLIEENTEKRTAFRRRDFWPLYTHRLEPSGNERLQVLAPLEPLIPNNKSIERLYSPVWSIWRAEKNKATGARSQSFLWNLYRQDVRPDSRKVSLLFGLFHYEKAQGQRHWRLFYIPIGRRLNANVSTP